MDSRRTDLVKKICDADESPSSSFCHSSVFSLPSYILLVHPPFTNRGMPCNNCSCGSEAASSSADKSTSVGVSTGAAVPLPRTKGSAKADSGEANSTSNNVWTLRPPSRGSTTPRSASPSRPAERDEQLQGILGDVQPLARKCGADEREGHQCCKDLKGDDERHLISPEIVRDV